MKNIVQLNKTVIKVVQMAKNMIVKIKRIVKNVFNYLSFFRYGATRRNHKIEPESIILIIQDLGSMGSEVLALHIAKQFMMGLLL